MSRNSKIANAAPIALEWVRTAAFSFAISAGLAASVCAEEIADGSDLMNRVDARPRGGDQLLFATWHLIPKSGRARVRETRSYWLDLRGREDSLRSKRLIVFDTPTQLEDTSFLVWSDGRVETDDLRWVYLPALRKIRRIAGRDRGKAFAGTDFNYEDLSDLHVDEEVHTLAGRSDAEQPQYWMVSSLPRAADSPYSKRIRWVHPDHYTTHRIEFYDRHERLLKTLEIEWQLGEEIWAWKRLVMRNHKSGHQTVIDVAEAQHGLGFEEDVFSQNRLRSGPPRVRAGDRTGPALPASAEPAGEEVAKAGEEAAGDVAGVAR